MSNHERIHIAQATELLVVPFYALWLGDFACGLMRHKGDAKAAYRHIRLEQEAFDHEADPTYLEKRPCFAWRAYPRAEVAERWKASEEELAKLLGQLAPRSHHSADQGVEPPAPTCSCSFV